VRTNFCSGKLCNRIDEPSIIRPISPYRNANAKDCQSHQPIEATAMDQNCDAPRLRPNIFTLSSPHLPYPFTLPIYLTHLPLPFTPTSRPLKVFRDEYPSLLSKGSLYMLLDRIKLLIISPPPLIISACRNKNRKQKLHRPSWKINFLTLSDHPRSIMYFKKGMR
jgi:hypothetical protein